ncbi:flagellar motor stator protein MotA [Acidihalobacter yilgarnensis]|uniref:Flagellar motor stator protein MotA n=1 Tax=Acidihalobacter yilgarnensis TaxID=2819280 RepID=A0A1D8IL60_9GAMM|nr:flagellar motor stator protein MotA [Acidihalobacter yilgarnensis]AOU97209.1 flagellar motor stator protein MotA [Acidihalobacter yilgarnensis]
MNTIIGFLIVTGSVVGGYILSHGDLATLLQPYELLIIGGSAFGAFMISNPMSLIMKTFKGVPTLMGGSKYGKATYLDLLTLMYDLFTKARKEGLMAVESDIEEPENSEIFSKYPKITKNHHALEFIVDYMRLIVSGGMNPFELDNLMSLELETHHHESHQTSNALTRVADGLPGFGIVAAVLGVVITMGSLDQPPQVIGMHVAAALVGTFLGILLAYGFVGPLAVALEHRAQEEANFFECIKTCILAQVQGYSPQIAVEFGRKAMYATVRPSFQALEEHLKGNRG